MSVRIGRFEAVRWAAIAVVVVELGIHAYLAPSHLEEKFYVGMLFVVADVLLAGVLVSLVTGLLRPLGWLLGAAVCAGMFVAFLLSRTTGLPGYHESWRSDHWLGLISLPPELVFIACALYAVRFRRPPAAGPYAVEVYEAEMVEARQATAAWARSAS
jgi:hypothetical protein